MILGQNSSEKDEKEKIEKLSFRSVPTGRGIENSKKRQKKLKKYHCDIISSQNSLEKAKKERKQKLSFCSIPT